MKVFIDTGFFVAFLNKRDQNHDRALQLMRELLNGGYGEASTSDYIFDEAVTVALVRTRKIEVAESVGKLILGDRERRFFNMVYVTEIDFMEAWRRFSGLAERGLSFTDCVSVTLMDTMGFDAVLSFDSDFDGIVTRIN